MTVDENSSSITRLWEKLIHLLALTELRQARELSPPILESDEGSMTPIMVNSAVEHLHGI